MSVKNLAKPAGQPADVAQVEAPAATPRTSVRLLATVGWEARGTSGAERLEASRRAAHPGIDHDEGAGWQKRSHPGVLDQRHHLVPGDVRE
jgi:hypothetical protein